LQDGRDAPALRARSRTIVAEPGSLPSAKAAPTSRM